MRISSDRKGARQSSFTSTTYASGTFAGRSVERPRFRRICHCHTPVYLDAILGHGHPEAVGRVSYGLAAVGVAALAWYVGRSRLDTGALVLA